MRLLIMSMLLVACGTSYQVQDPDAAQDAQSDVASETQSDAMPGCVNQEVCRIITQPNGAAFDLCCGMPVWYTVTGGQCINQPCPTGQPCYLSIDGGPTRQGTCL